MEGPLIIEAGRILREKGEETKLHMTVQPTYLGWRDFVFFFFSYIQFQGIKPRFKTSCLQRAQGRLNENIVHVRLFNK